MTACLLVALPNDILLLLLHRDATELQDPRPTFSFNGANLRRRRGARVPSVGRLGRRLFVERIGSHASDSTPTGGAPIDWLHTPCDGYNPPPPATNITRAALRKYFSHPTRL